MKQVLCIFTFLITSTQLFSQHIVDNQLAFGFKNIFGWNVVIMQQVVSESNVRMIMFSDISTVKKQFITVDLQQRKSRTYESFLNSNAIVIDSLPNPNERKPTYILKVKDNEHVICAIIDHFDYLLRVTYYDSINEIDRTTFRKLIESYINIKIDL